MLGPLKGHYSFIPGVHCILVLFMYVLLPRKFGSFEILFVSFNPFEGSKFERITSALDCITMLASRGGVDTSPALTKTNSSE